jgi:uncharacterized 2Fe-2S/4Fe-4S cluster protein (DUF4445 family)
VKERLLALDLGTTTLAGALLTRQGEVVAQDSLPNPQVREGADVVTRLQVALHGRGEALQRLLAEGINTLVRGLLEKADTPPQAIAAAAAAGNPAISALLCGRPVERLLFPPHRLSWRAGEEVEPRPIGLDLPVPLFLFPLAGGFVGGDLVAFLYAAGRAPAPSLYLDVGTNAEIALDTGTRWWATSAAAGPAFEGGNISCGMPASAGAVEGVAVDGDRLRLRVVGGGPPQGICGSGLAAAVAAGLQGGLIDSDGTIREPREVADNLARYVVERGDERGLCLYRDAAHAILLRQSDLRQFQLAKGAVRAGVECLLERAGLAPEALRQVVVSGAFGLALTPEILKHVAIFPEKMLDKVVFVPGGALQGVARLLNAPKGRQEVARLAASLSIHPLSGSPRFERAFLQSLDFRSSPA